MNSKKVDPKHEEAKKLYAKSKVNHFGVSSKKTNK